MLFLSDLMTITIKDNHDDDIGDTNHDDRNVSGNINYICHNGIIDDNHNKSDNKNDNSNKINNQKN